jgi:hypothetical protein
MSTERVKRVLDREDRRQNMRSKGDLEAPTLVVITIME